MVIEVINIIGSPYYVKSQIGILLGEYKILNISLRGDQVWFRDISINAAGARPAGANGTFL
jgi:hypothetical protein